MNDITDETKPTETVDVTATLERHQIPEGHPQPYLVYHTAEFACPACGQGQRISSRDRWDLFDKVITEGLAIQCCGKLVRPRLPRLAVSKMGPGANRHERRANAAKRNGG